MKGIFRKSWEWSQFFNQHGMVGEESEFQGEPIMAFLVCDPVPTTAVQPTSYKIIIDGGTPIVAPVQKNADNSVQLHYDVSGLTDGAHAISVSAVDAFGGSTSIPFSFVKGVPAAPTGLAISLT